MSNSEEVATVAVETPREDVPAKAKKLAVFIDGQNLFGLTSVLGVRRVDFAGLLSICRSLEPAMEILAPPIYTLQINAFTSMEKVLGNSGFDPRLESASSGDKALIREIERVSPDEVGAVVVVTGDGDFVEPLRRLAERGVNVHILSLRENIKPDPAQGRTRGYGCSYLLKEPPFHFVDLGGRIGEMALAASPTDNGAVVTVPTISPPPQEDVFSATLWVADIPPGLLRDVTKRLADFQVDLRLEFPSMRVGIE